MPLVQACSLYVLQCPSDFFPPFFSPLSPCFLQEKPSLQPLPYSSSPPLLPLLFPGGPRQPLPSQAYSLYSSSGYTSRELRCQLRPRGRDGDRSVVYKPLRYYSGLLFRLGICE